MDEHPQQQPGAHTHAPKAAHDTSIKDTLISLITAFVIAFILRTFTIEPFIIPTGSMAPTLLGAHVKVRNDTTSRTWAVAPRDYLDQNQQHPATIQAIPSLDQDPLFINDRITSEHLSLTNAPLRAGDRILVLKYIYALNTPKRWDVVVFHHPETPHDDDSLIKRLIGLPGETVRIIDGDIFTKPNNNPDADWTIQRKPQHIQRTLWQTVYDPRIAQPEETTTRLGPWIGDDWSAHSTSITTTKPNASLRWDLTATGPQAAPRWPINDWTDYNDTPALANRIARYPVSDLLMEAGVEPERAGLSIDATIEARNHFFQCHISGSKATLRMKPDNPGAEWTILKEATIPASALAPGRVTNISFSHFDQSLELRINNKRVARAEYNWTADERLMNAIKPRYTNQENIQRPYPHELRRPALSWAFSQSPLTLHNPTLSRDLAHQPSRWDDLFRVDKDQFFVLGDNSAVSRDSRGWETIDPWLQAQTPVNVGFVPRELMIGKAFFVYFPSPDRSLRRIPIPAIGQLRAIR